VVDKQYRKGRFNRMDMVMRLVVMENGGDWWKIYRKMQFVRIAKIREIRKDKFPPGFEKRRVVQFKALIESMKEKGYDPEVKGIRLAKNMELANGSHRLACCIHFGIEKILVKWPCDSTLPRRGYSLKWFHKHGFPLFVIKALEDRRVKMLKELGLKDRTTNDYYAKISS